MLFPQHDSEVTMRIMNDLANQLAHASNAEFLDNLREAVAW